MTVQAMDVRVAAPAEEVAADTTSPHASASWPCGEVLPIGVLPDQRRRSDIAEHLTVVRAAARRDARHGLVRVPRVRPDRLPPVVSLTRWQTPFRFQNFRGTGSAFAVVAAMEAEYLRLYGVALHLSEQYAIHVAQAGELYPGYTTSPKRHENNSSYWGFRGSSDLASTLSRAAIPDEQSARYLSRAEMTLLRPAVPEAGDLADADDTPQENLDAFEFSERHIPTHARHRAHYRIADNAVVSLGMNPSIATLQSVIASGHEVIADVPAHCFLLVGYDRPRREWLVKDSRGQNAFVRVGFDDPDWPILAGHYLTSVVAPTCDPQLDAWWIGRWNIDVDGRRGELVVRRTTDYRGAPGTPTKLGNFYCDGWRYDVNGLTEDDGRTLHFWIADTTDRIPAGTPSGQEVHAHLFSWDPRNAAGHTTQQGVPFGVTLSRNPLDDPSFDRAARSGFEGRDWVGTWALNHDGFRGLLEIDSVDPLRARYTPPGGRPLPATGSVTAHRLTLSVDFADTEPQLFRLLAHTGEHARLSGTTTWHGHEYGVQGTHV
jgi:hypothetical protein